MFYHNSFWLLSWDNWQSLITWVSSIGQKTNVTNVKISHFNWLRAKLFQNVRPDPERHSDQLRICVCLVSWPEHHEGAGGAPGQGEDRTDKGDPLGRCWCARAQHYHHLKRTNTQMHQAEYNIGGEKMLPTWVMDCGAASNMHSEKGLNRGEINYVAQR